MGCLTRFMNPEKAKKKRDQRKRINILARQLGCIQRHLLKGYLTVCQALVVELELPPSGEPLEMEWNLDSM